MSQTYRKYMVGRHFVKVYSYERLNVRRSKVKKQSEPMTDVELDVAYRYRQRAKKEKLIHLADVNFITSECSFATLTFAQNVAEYETAVKEFKQFGKRLRRKFDGIRYIATVEAQQRGAIHFHVLLNVPWNEENTEAVKECWTAGMAEIVEVFSVKRCMLYMCKGFEEQDRTDMLFGKRCYFVSQGFNQCVQINNWNSTTADKTSVRLMLQGQQPIKVRTVETEHAGQVEYREYCMDTQYYTVPETAKLKK